MKKISYFVCYLFAMLGGLLIFSTTSCVSMQTYRDTQARALRSEYNASNLQAEIDQLREQRDALEAQYNALDSMRIAEELTITELPTDAEATTEESTYETN